MSARWPLTTSKNRRVTVVSGAKDDVVLVLAHAGLSFGGERADYLIGAALDPDILADGIGVREKIGDDSLAEDHHFAGWPRSSLSSNTGPVAMVQLCAVR